MVMLRVTAGAGASDVAAAGAGAGGKDDEEEEEEEGEKEEYLRSLPRPESGRGPATVSSQSWSRRPILPCPHQTRRSVDAIGCVVALRRARLGRMRARVVTSRGERGRREDRRVGCLEQLRLGPGRMTTVLISRESRTVGWGRIFIEKRGRVGVRGFRRDNWRVWV